MKIGYTDFLHSPNDQSQVRVGNQVAFVIEVFGVSLATAQTMIHQLHGYAASPDPVAVVWDDDTSLNGLYQVTNVTVNPIENYVASGMMSCAVTMVRFDDPVIETDYTLTYRSAPTNYYIAAPFGYSSAALEESAMWVMDNGDFYMQGDPLSVSGPVGNGDGLIDTGTRAAATLTEVQVQQGVLPERFNVGQSVIDAWTTGVGWWPVTGPALPEQSHVRVSNGIIRVIPVVGERYLLVECWTGTAWLGVGRVVMEWDSVADGQFTRRWQLVRNNRCQVVLRCHLTRGTFRPVQVDIAITRGVAAVTVMMTTGFEGVSWTGRAELQNYAGTDMLTSTWASATGVHRTNAVDGMRVAIVGDDAPTASTTTDDLVWTAATTHRFSICPTPVARHLDEHLTNYQITDMVI